MGEAGHAVASGQATVQYYSVLFCILFPDRRLSIPVLALAAANFRHKAREGETNPVREFFYSNWNCFRPPRIERNWCHITIRLSLSSIHPFPHLHPCSQARVVAPWKLGAGPTNLRSLLLDRPFLLDALRRCVRVVPCPDCRQSPLEPRLSDASSPALSGETLLLTSALRFLDSTVLYRVESNWQTWVAPSAFLTVQATTCPPTRLHLQLQLQWP